MCDLRLVLSPAGDFSPSCFVSMPFCCESLKENAVDSADITSCFHTNDRNVRRSPLNQPQMYRNIADNHSIAHVFEIIFVFYAFIFCFVGNRVLLC